MTTPSPFALEMFRQNRLEEEARSFIDLAYMAGYDRVCWKHDAPYDTWALASWIIALSWEIGYPVHGGYDMGQPKDHGNLKRFQGYPPIPGRTLFL